MSSFTRFLCSFNRSTADASYTRPLLQIEEDFDSCWAVTWMSNHWTACYPIIGVYLVVIFAGQAYMRSRPPFQLRLALFIWNVVLAMYSAISSWRTLTATVYSLQTYGLWSLACSVNHWGQIQAICLWGFLFSFSKVLELGDTVFIVLRKTPLIVLHWYHHVSVLFFTWSSSAYPSPMQAMFCTVNLFVHSFMYSYYALRALQFRIPKLVCMAITLLQLVQMVFGMLLTGLTYYTLVKYPSCMVTHQAIVFAAIIYFSYFLLFLNFFIRSYVAPRRLVDSETGRDKKTM